MSTVVDSTSTIVVNDENGTSNELVDSNNVDNNTETASKTTIIEKEQGGTGGGGGGGGVAVVVVDDKKPNNKKNDTTTTTTDINSIIGIIRGQYLCSYGNWNGTLFAGTFGIMFIASFFLFEKKLVLLWYNVANVCEGSTTGSSADCADVIMISDNNNKNNNNNNNSNNRAVHRFVRDSSTSSGIFNRDKLWITLVALHNESLLMLGNGSGDADDDDNHNHNHNSTSHHRNDTLSSLTSSTTRLKSSIEQQVTTTDIRKSHYSRRNSDPMNKSTIIPSSLQNELMILDYNEDMDDDNDNDNDGDKGQYSKDGIEVQYSNTRSNSGSDDDDGGKVQSTNSIPYDMSKDTLVKSNDSTTKIKAVTTTPPLTTISGSMEIAEVEKITGQMLLPPIHCTNNDDGINGKLYTGRNALYFTGRRFFWEQSTICMIWSDIVNIKTISVLSVDQQNGPGGKRSFVGISVTTSSTSSTSTSTKKSNNNNNNNNDNVVDTKIYSFINMDNADQVWASLSALHNDYSSLLRRQSIIIGNQSNKEQTLMSNQSTTTSSTSTRPGVRRRNSDPFFRSNRIGLDSVTDLIQSEENDIVATNTKAKSSSSSSSSSTFGILAVDAAAKSQVITSRSKKEIPISTVTTIIPTQEKNDGIEVPTLTQTKIINQNGLLVCTSTNDDIDGWMKATIDNPESKKMYPTILINNIQIQDCPSIDTFFDLFLGNNAKYALLGKFLETRGDTNIKAEDWYVDDNLTVNNNNNNNNRPTYKRIVRYIHPVNVPLAPPQATARREQTYTHYGPYTGIVLESRTYVDDVPMADCFYATERFRITPGTELNTVAITIDFGLTFVKSTMFKGIITKKTTSEVTETLTATIKFINESIAASTKKANEIISSSTTTQEDSTEEPICNKDDTTNNPITTQNHLVKDEKGSTTDGGPSETDPKHLFSSSTPTSVQSPQSSGFQNIFSSVFNEINNIINNSHQIPIIPMLLSIVVVLLLILCIIQTYILSELRATRTAEANVQLQILNELRTSTSTTNIVQLRLLSELQDIRSTITAEEAKWWKNTPKV